jgi:hypothetical protein
MAPDGDSVGRLERRRGVRILASSTATVLAASVLTACGAAATRATPVASKARPEPTARRAAVALLFRSDRQLLLNIPHVGRLYARCDRQGVATTEVRVAFVERSSLTTVETSGRHVRTTQGSSLVAAKPPGGAGTQLWQVGPISEAPKPLATIWVGISHYPPNRGCVVSAHSSTTLTGSP